MIINSKTAKLAEEKGFDMDCEKSWRIISSDMDKTKRVSLGDTFPRGSGGEPVGVRVHLKYLAPTQSELQAWLRNSHNIDAWAAPYIGKDAKDYGGMLYKNKQEIQIDHEFDGESFEEAQENILFEALKHV